ncbi:MAG: hypothetical protein IPL79_09005 [Myxococcales bacterium]|nr:hypothetical protein [Myxococcales bacterium]
MRDLARLLDGLERLRGRRGLHLLAANLRLLIGFAFLPAAIKKVLGQPFTEPTNVGRFHDFLHAFFATGWFYEFVGVVQLVAATLLLTQTWALLGAVIALPMLTAIVAFCWSTQVYPTAIVASGMWLATVALLIWDAPRLAHLAASSSARARETPLIELGLWRGCGVGIMAIYLAACLAHGGVYRPRGAAWDDPIFYVLPAIALMPVVTWLIERARRKQPRM